MLFMGFLSSVGTSGMNAMAATGMSADADCGDCDCGLCSLDNWDIYPGGDHDYGFITARDNETGVITGTSADHTLSGQYFFIMQTGDDEECCQILDIKIDGVSVPFTGIKCSETFPVIPVIIGDCVHLLQYQSFDPFTVEVTLTPC
jgi:hypothetical protein